MYIKINKQLGFSLAELMVVVSIVTILSVIVFGSIAFSRSKANDTRRISDIKEIQLALALYYEVNRVYPVSTGAGLSVLTASDAQYWPTVPVDPKTGASYGYYTTGSNPRTYCLGALLELTDAIPSDTVIVGPNGCGLDVDDYNYQVKPQL